MKFKLGPKSLLGQNLLLMAGLIIAAQLIALLLFVQVVQKPRLQAVVRTTNAHVDAVTQALRLMPTEARHAYIAQLNLLGDMVVRVGGTVEDEGKLFGDPLLRLSIGGVAKRREVVWTVGPPPRMWFKTAIEGQSYWLGLDVTGLVLGVGGAALGIMSATFMLALAGAVLIQRRINRPLRQLVAATKQVGEGQPPHGLPERAPTEIASLVEGFQHMSHRLSQHEKEREVMLAGVSHDVRTPLTKISLGLAMINPRAGEEDLIAGMERQVASIDAIVGQFIDFARLGGGETLQRLHVDDFVRQWFRGHAGDVKEMSVRLDADCQAWISPVALRRALDNLVQNAQRYAPGPLSIETRVVRDEVEILVVDCGPGVPAAELARVREPFQRLDEARAGHPGAGLGLAIVERVAALHRGRVHYFSRARALNGQLPPAEAGRVSGGFTVCLVLPVANS